MNSILLDTEMSIMKLVNKGYSSEKEIAKLLQISVHTVKSCMRSIKIKSAQTKQADI